MKDCKPEDDFRENDRLGICEPISYGTKCGITCYEYNGECVEYCPDGLYGYDEYANYYGFYDSQIVARRCVEECPAGHYSYSYYYNGEEVKRCERCYNGCLECD